MISLYRLSLPESVDNGTASITDDIVVPQPRLRVDWFTNTAKDLE